MYHPITQVPLELLAASGGASGKRQGRWVVLFTGVGMEGTSRETDTKRQSGGRGWVEAPHTCEQEGGSRGREDSKSPSWPFSSLGAPWRTLPFYGSELSQPLKTTHGAIPTQLELDPKAQGLLQCPWFMSKHTMFPAFPP